MSTPEGSTAPEGGTPPEGNDDAAQQALAAAAQEAGDGNEANDDGDDDEGEQFDAERARRKIAKVNREAQSLREELKKLKPLAAEAEKRRQGEMTEAQKLTEQKAALEVELAELRTSNVRREAAEAAGLTPTFVKFITAAEPDEALAQAKELAKAVMAGAGETQGRQKTDLRQGNRGATNSGSQSPDDLLRAMARGR